MRELWDILITNLAGWSLLLVVSLAVYDREYWPGILFYFGIVIAGLLLTMAVAWHKEKIDD